MKHQTWMSILAGSLAVMGTSTTDAADTGFYLSAGMGLGQEKPGTSNGITLSSGFPADGILHIEPDEIIADGDDLAWSVGGGYRFSRYVSAEVEYMEFGATEISEHYRFEPPFPFYPDELRFGYTSKITGPALSVLGTLPIGKRFELFLRAGALFADREIQLQAYTDEGPSTFGDTVWLGGAGIDWSFARHWAIRAEYQRSGDFTATLVAGESAVEWTSLRLRFKF